MNDYRRGELIILGFVVFVFVIVGITIWIPSQNFVNNPVDREVIVSTPNDSTVVFEGVDVTIASDAFDRWFYDMRSRNKRPIIKYIRLEVVYQDTSLHNLQE